jgi:hypothetical protein
MNILAIGKTCARDERGARQAHIYTQSTASSGCGSCACMRRRTLAKSFASCPEEAMLDIFLPASRPMVPLHTHAACRRARTVSHPWRPLRWSQGQWDGGGVGCRLRVVSRDDRMRCGVLEVVICLFLPWCRLCGYERVFRGTDRRRLLVCLQGWMLRNN